MKLSNKIKYLLNLSEISQTDYALKCKKSPQSINRKIQNGAFSIKDIVELCKLTKTSLAVLDKDYNILFEITGKDFE